MNSERTARKSHYEAGAKNIEKYNETSFVQMDKSPSSETSFVQMDKSDLQAVHELNSRMTEAVNTISEIMLDKEASSSDRLRAAGMILDNAGKFAERMQKAETDIDKEFSMPSELDFTFDVLKTCFD